MTTCDAAAAFAPRTRTLRDGRSVELRAMQPGDEAELLQAFERMPADARFMRVVREVNLDRLLQEADCAGPDVVDGTDQAQ